MKVEFPDFRKEQDPKEVMEILYKALTEISAALRAINPEEPYPKEIRLFAWEKEKLLPRGFRECDGMNGTFEITDLSEMIITQKLQ